MNTKKQIIILLITLLLAMGLISLMGCSDANNALYVTEVILPYYCDGVVNPPSNIKVTYLPENDKDSYKIQVKFNKELSENNIRNLYYVQMGTFFPVMSAEKESPNKIEYDRYKVNGSTIEVSNYDWNQNEYFVNPMKYSSLYIPSDIRAKDGSKLDKDFGIHFSMGISSPHMEFDYINSVMNPSLTPTIVIPMTSGENSIWSKGTKKTRNVGYVTGTYADIYSKKDMSKSIDKISFGANVELLETKDNYCKVRYYVPRALEDSKHHSKYALSPDIDIFESDYLIKKEGYIKSEDIGIIEPFKNQGCKISVFTSDAYTHDQTNELYVKNELYPYTGSFLGQWYPKIRIYECVEDKEINKERVRKKITNDNVDALEVSGYSYMYEVFQSDTFNGRVDENGESLSMNDKRQHDYLVKYFKNDRETVDRLMSEYNSFLLDIWERAIGCEEGKAYKERYEYLFNGYIKLGKIWNKWSEIDPELKPSTYVKLIEDNFEPEYREKIEGCFKDADTDLTIGYVDFVNNILWKNINDEEVYSKLKKSFEESSGKDN